MQRETHRPGVVVVEGNLKDGYYGGGFKSTEINLLSLPLNFKFNFIQRKKWRVYAMAGAALQVATQANYYTAGLDGFRTPTFAPEPPGPAGNTGSSFLEQKEIPGGIFEGGSFQDNSYLTGSFGLGAETLHFTPVEFVCPTHLSASI